MGKLKNLVDFLFILVSLLLSLVDIGLDIFAAVSFYQEEAYMYLGILLVFLLVSSVIAQIFSWLLYSYNGFDRCLSKSKLKLIHVFQLGIFFRMYQRLRVATKSFVCCDLNTIRCCLCHHLNVLRLLETFLEDIPQLILMLTIMLQRGHEDTITGLKAFGSALFIAISVTMYHCSLLSFLPDYKKQSPPSLAVYFFWNLLLISSRLTALALFASVLPCFISIHFFCSWIVLFFFSWRYKTEFMQSPCGEWLFRATVGLIWYFNWFNVVEGKTRYKTLLYHGYILVDNILLCSLWCWKMNSEPPYLIILVFHTKITAACVVSVYVIGLLLRKVYYQCCHPDLTKDELKWDTDGDEEPLNLDDDVADDVADDDTPLNMPSQHYNTKMRELAVNFFTS